MDIEIECVTVEPVKYRGLPFVPILSDCPFNLQTRNAVVRELQAHNHPPETDDAE